MEPASIISPPSTPHDTPSTLSPLYAPPLVQYTDDNRDDTPSIAPTVHFIRDILDDDTYSKYSTYSDVNICQAANLGPSDVGQFTMDPVHPPPLPEPPPSTNHTFVQDIHNAEWVCDESHPVSVAWNKDRNPPPYKVTPDTTHILWNTLMFPTEDMEIHSITPVTNLTLLAVDGESRFTVLLRYHCSPTGVSVYKPTAVPTAW